MLKGVRENIFREPRHRSMDSWLWVVFGVSGVLLGGLILAEALTSPSVPGIFGLLGAWIALQGGAELLPRGWSMLAGAMRLTGAMVLLEGLLRGFFP